MEIARLNTNDLLAIMHTEPNFIGVFASDELPHSVPPDVIIKLIVNLQPRHLPGLHWTAIYRKKRCGFYFDTFGRPPPPRIANWLTQNCLTWKYNETILQAPNDTVSCGYICMEFLKQLK
jgi:hypothetical protein